MATRDALAKRWEQTAQVRAWTGIPALVAGQGKSRSARAATPASGNSVSAGHFLGRNSGNGRQAAPGQGDGVMAAREVLAERLAQAARWVELLDAQDPALGAR